VFAKNNPDVPVYMGTGAQVCDYELTSFNTSHDSQWSVGYVIKDIRKGDCKIAYITDLGEVTPAVRAATLGANVVFAESNYDPVMLRNNFKYPKVIKDRISSSVGHLSNADSADYICSLVGNGATRVILGHLSRENNTPRMAFDTVAGRLADAGMRLDYDYTLNIAEVQTTGKYINI
jgi:phosphoribosyl 1,2-cyclic phosphodiesterase